MSDETDPLDGAAIGETRRVPIEIEQSVWVFSAVNDWIGSDRDPSNVRLADVEFVDTPGDEQVVLTLEADVTKQLPRNWDQPITEHPRHIRNQPLSRRQRLFLAGVKAVAYALPFGIGFGVLAALPKGTMTINGEEMVFPPPMAEMAPVLALVVGVAALIWLLLAYAPVPARRGGRRA